MEFTPTISVNQPGTYIVWAQETIFCLGSDTLVIAPGGMPPTLAGPPALCTGQSGSVEVTNAANFTNFNWSNGSTSSAITVNAPGTYTVTVTAAGGCTATGSAEVIAISSNMTINGNASPVTSCTTSNGAVDITVSPTGAYIYIWSNGAGSEDLINIPAGNYTVTVTEAGGCSAMGADLVAIQGETVKLKAEINVPPSALESVLWQPDSLFNCPQGLCLEHEIEPQAQTEINITVTDTFGCQVTDRLMLYVRKDEDVYIPNVFSPNGDGVNDVFTIFGDDSVLEIVEFRIFQRWGEFVYFYQNFPPNDLHYGWDGTYEGTALNPQVFVYWVVVKFKDGREQFFEGGITLVK